VCVYVWILYALSFLQKNLHEGNRKTELSSGLQGETSQPLEQSSAVCSQSRARYQLNRQNENSRGEHTLIIESFM
jgi:hypothetical protein